MKNWTTVMAMTLALGLASGPAVYAEHHEGSMGGQGAQEAGEHGHEGMKHGHEGMKHEAGMTGEAQEAGKQEGGTTAEKSEEDKKGMTEGSH